VHVFVFRGGGVGAQKNDDYVPRTGEWAEPNVIGLSFIKHGCTPRSNQYTAFPKTL